MFVLKMTNQYPCPNSDPRYAIAALSVVCLYSIITTLVSFWALRKQAATLIKLMFSIYVMDVVRTFQQFYLLS